MLLTRVKKKIEQSGLRLNAKKTKVVLTSGELGEFTTAGETFEGGDSFTFLGARFDKDGGCTSDITRRIAMGKVGMTGLYRVMKDRTMSVPTNVRLVKTLL